MDKSITKLEDVTSRARNVSVRVRVLNVWWQSAVGKDPMLEMIVGDEQVVADKQLVKHLQKEVTRLKAELLSPEPSSSKCLRSLLLEKEQKIHQMEREMNELKRERDLALSQLEVARKLQKETKESIHGGPSRQVAKCLSFSSENVSASGRELLEKKTQRRRRTLRQSTASLDPCMLVHEITKLDT